MPLTSRKLVQSKLIDIEPTREALCLLPKRMLLIALSRSKSAGPLANDFTVKTDRPHSPGAPQCSSLVNRRRGTGLSGDDRQASHVTAQRILIYLDSHRLPGSGRRASSRHGTDNHARLWSRADPLFLRLRPPAGAKGSLARNDQVPNLFRFDQAG
jgi:hypothetical protein